MIDPGPLFRREIAGCHLVEYRTQSLDLLKISELVELLIGVEVFSGDGRLDDDQKVSEDVRHSQLSSITTPGKIDSEE